MTVRCEFLRGILFLSLCGAAATPSFAQVNSSVPPNEIRVTLLGTGSGPRAFVDKAGISTLVEAGGERLLFDAGRGSMQRLVQAGFPRGYGPIADWLFERAEWLGGRRFHAAVISQLPKSPHDMPWAAYARRGSR